MTSQPLQPYQAAFVEFLVRQGALRFGTFTLRSGRTSPYFVNIGAIDDGPGLRQLGSFYAGLLRDRFPGGVDVLFGPAYKGIPIATAAAVALDAEAQTAVKVTFDRKEAKKHGERGKVFGHTPGDGDRIVILDDVFTTGATKEEAVDFLRAFGDVRCLGVAIAVDRLEAQEDGRSAVRLFEESRGVPVHAIVTVRDIVAHLRATPVDGRIVIDETTERNMQEYLDTYGLRA